MPFFNRGLLHFSPRGLEWAAICRFPSYSFPHLEEEDHLIMARRVSLHRGRVSLLVVLVALALTSLPCVICGMFAPDPTPQPTVDPSAEPSGVPTHDPTPEPTPEPTDEPTQASASGGVKDDGTPSTGPSASL